MKTLLGNAVSAAEERFMNEFYVMTAVCVVFALATLATAFLADSLLFE